MKMSDPFKGIIEFNRKAGNTRQYRELDSAEVICYKNLVDEEHKELEEAFAAGDRKEVVDALADIIVVAVGMLDQMGYDPYEVMRIVNESNLSKFCGEGIQADAIETVLSYKDDKRYKNPVAYSNGSVWAEVVATGSQKILKSINYQPPRWCELDEQFNESDTEGNV
jgi:phosphoribosyl-ATP pyrophosphohydrolase